MAFDPTNSFVVEDEETGTTFDPTQPFEIEEEPSVAGFDPSQPFEIEKVEPMAPEPEESFLRPIADPFLNIGAGINDVVKGFTDTFGADNAVSQNLAKNSEWYRSLLSAGAKQDAEEIGRIMQEAEGQGVLAEIGAGLKALSVAPIDLVSQGIGSLIPFIATAGVGKAVGLSKAGIAVLQGVQGGAVGGGIVKGEIYSAVKEQLINSGVDEAKAEKAANEAQAYNGKNLDQILLGVGLGVAASSTGAEGAIRGLITRKMGKEAAATVTEREIQEVLRNGFVRGAAKGLAVEGTTEALQGGQEAYAAGKAVQREGFDVDPMAGVFTQATLEGGIGAILGAPAGGIGARVEQLDMRERVALRDAANAAQEAKQNNAPASAAAVEEQIEQTLEETPEQKVARLQEEATAAAGIELEEEGGVEPTVPTTPPVAPTPEGAVAPVEPVVEPVVAEPQPVTEVAPTEPVAPEIPTPTISQPATEGTRYFIGSSTNSEPQSGIGAFLTTDEAEAKEYARGRVAELGGETVLREVFSPVTNPIDINQAKALWADETDGAAFNMRGEKGETIKGFLKSRGFDGMLDGPHVIVFDPSQIKSVEEVTPTTEAPNLEPLRRVARAEQAPEDIPSLVEAGLVEVYKDQPVLTDAGLAALPEAERPRLTPEARKIQIDTGANEVVAEAISKNLRIGVDQVGPNVTLPAGWTLDGDIYVPPAAPEVRESRREPALAGSQVVFISDPNFPNEIPPKEYHKINKIPVNEFGDIGSDTTKIVESMKNRASKVKDKVYGKKFVVKINKESFEFARASSLEKFLDDVSGGSIAHVFKSGNNQIVADFDNVPFNIERSFAREESRLSMRETEPVKTLAGTVIKRYKNNVGKQVGEQIYVHRDYASEVVPEEALSRAPQGFAYNSVMYNTKTGAIRFDEAPDFDTAREPKVGKYITVQPNGTQTSGQSNSIWHHKWLWVKDDYDGFNTEDSRDWSRQWLSKVSEVAKGTKQTFEQQLQKYGVQEEVDSFVTPEENARFLELAKNPEANKDEGQKMVDEAARRASFITETPLYHFRDYQISFDNVQRDIDVTKQVNEAIGSKQYPLGYNPSSTSISRSGESSILSQIRKSNLISKGERVLHAGAGRENNPDRKALDELSGNVRHYDPAIKADSSRSDIGNAQYDKVVSPFVLNVLSQKDRINAIKDIITSLKPDGTAIIGVRGQSDVPPINDQTRKKTGWTPYSDGWLVPKAGWFTFQRGFTAEQLAEEIKPFFEDVKIERSGAAPIVIASRPKVNAASTGAIARGVQNDFGDFGAGIYLTPISSLEMAKKQYWWPTTLEGKYREKVYAKIERPFFDSVMNAGFPMRRDGDAVLAMSEYVDVNKLMNRGDKAETHLGSAKEIVVKNANQIKSADPFTYDDQGNIIPLNERFRKTKADIRYRRMEMPRPAGMETEAVATKLESLGFGRGGIVSVVNEPNATFEGRTIIRDGKVVGIELNAAALKDDAAVERVLNHEIAESANADGALNNLVAGLTPKERKEINDAITRLGYAERARTAEEAARAVELLAEGWRGRRWFERAVARVEAWANKLGYKLTRRAAEYIAARNVSEINQSFKQAYNKFINVQGEAREGRAFVTPAENARFLELAQNPEANREELQKMVDAAAEKAGFKVFDWWHGTKQDFNTFKATRYEDGLIFFSSKRDFSERWAKNRKPNEKILKRIESVRKESNKLVEDLFAADPRFDLKKPWSENTAEMNEAAKKYLEAGKELERSKLDGMTWVEAEREMGTRIIRAYLGSGQIFNPAENWREFLPQILKRLGIKSESEIDSQTMAMILEGNYILWEDKALIDAVFEKYNAIMIQESAGEPMDTVAVRDPSLIKMADPVTRDDQGNVIPLSERFQTATPDIRYSIRESRREDAIPTFSEGSPEASTLSTMAASMAKVDAASEAKPNPENKPTYKISEIASVWMDQGGDTRQLQDLISENTLLSPANAKKVASAIAKQYGIQQEIALAATPEVLPETITPEAEDRRRPKTTIQRVLDAITGVRVPPVKITANEKTLLKDQIKLKAAAYRDAKKAQQETAAEMVEAIKEMDIRGPIRPKQVAALMKRAVNVNFASETSVDKFIDYAAKVIENANYDRDVSEAKAAQKRAKEIAKRKNVGAPQKRVLEDLAKIEIKYLNDPREFAEAVNYYMRAFKSPISDGYQVIPDKEMNEYLTRKEAETQQGIIEADQAYRERLAEKYGVPLEEVNAVLDAEDVQAALVQYAKREGIEGMINEKVRDGLAALQRYNTTGMTQKQQELVQKILDLDIDGISTENRIQLIRDIDNILVNGQTNGVQRYVAAAEGQSNAFKASKNKTFTNQQRAWINIFFGQTLGKKTRGVGAEDQKEMALSLQSIADTFRNIFGKKNLGLISQIMGFGDLLLGNKRFQTDMREATEETTEFFNKLEKKYGVKVVSDNEGKIAEGVTSYLIQQFPLKTEEESIITRRSVIMQDVQQKRQTGDSEAVSEADIVAALLERIDGDSVQEILNNLKREFPANYESVMWYKDTFLPKYKDFLREFDENFNNQANNYDNPNYLPIAYTFAKDAELTPEEQRKYYNTLSLTPKQAANSVKRQDYENIPRNKGGKPAAISYNLRNTVYSSLSDQLKKAHTSAAWAQIQGFVNSKAAIEVFGNEANRGFMARRLELLQDSQDRRGYQSDGFSKVLDSVAIFLRRIGIGIGLGGVGQVIKQAPDQIVTTIANTGDPQLSFKNLMIMMFTKDERADAMKLMSKFSIGERGDAAMGGAQFMNPLESGFSNLEKFVRGGQWARIKDTARRVSDVWLIALKKSDFWAASSGWMTYYQKKLEEEGGTFTDWANEAKLVDTDPVRQRAAYHAELMIDLYQGSSDPTRMARLSQRGKSGYENAWKGLFLAFNSFVLQQRVRMHSDLGEGMSKQADPESAKLARRGLSGTIAGILLFHLMRRYALPAISGTAAYGVYIMLGIDPEEPDEEKKKADADFQLKRFYSEVAGNVLVGGFGSIVEQRTLDALNQGAYMMSRAVGSDWVLDDEGETMDFAKWKKDKAPFWYYQDYKGGTDLGIFGIGFDQLANAQDALRKATDPELRDTLTTEEQRLLSLAAFSEILYLARLNDADVDRMISRMAKETLATAKEREAAIRRIQSGR